jgi:putative peptidoglycan lipid II flippase
MFLKAATVSLALLIASRLLGLARESTQAAALGASGLADVAVLMLTLPDWLAGLLASGALSYVLLPAWAAQASPAAVQQMQRQVARFLLAGGVVLGALLALAVWFSPVVSLQVLAPGLPRGLQALAAQALLFSALALPAALLAALWSTRLQHEQDFVGLYAANLVVNGVLIAALLSIAVRADSTSSTAVLGIGLLLAMALRLVWLMHRQRRLGPVAAQPVQPAALPLPAASLWLWAALSAGLPLALPFVARSLASQQGEGALAVFNYAWKLVELPLVLAIQLVASLAFPGIARAFAANTAHPDTQPVTQAFVLAWTLACAAAAALLMGAPAIAQLLFGWGRMPAAALAQIAQWGATGAWGLLPLALLSVALTVLAAQSRMRAAVAAFALALVVLVVLGASVALNGLALMWLLNALYAGVAVACVLVATRGRLSMLRGWLPLRAMAAPLLMLLGFAALSNGGFLPVYAGNWPFELIQCAGAAIFLIVFSYAASADLRRALRR